MRANPADMSELQDPHAQVLVRDATARAIGTRLWPVMPEVFTSRSQTAALRVEHDVDASPTTAADDVEGRERQRLQISCSFSPGRPHGQRYFVSSEKYLFW